MKLTLLTLLVSALSQADSINNLQLARTAMNRGELVNAEQILNTAIDEAQAKFGRNAPQLDSGLEMLAQVYQREKRYADAASVQQWRLDIWTGIAGENGVIVGRVLYQLSAVQRQAGDLPAAESNSRRALAIMTAAYIDKPPAAQAAVDLADILISENRSDEAEQMLALAEKTFETSLGPTSPLTAGVTARRSNLLKQLGRAQPVQPANPSAAIVYKIGGAVTPPRILSKVEPQYSEEARKNKLQGSISISLVIDATGAPTQIAVLRPIGLGLDEMAVNAVSQWRFSSGTKNGAPVPVFTQIEMTFHLL